MNKKYRRIIGIIGLIVLIYVYIVALVSSPKVPITETLWDAFVLLISFAILICVILLIVSFFVWAFEDKYTDDD